MSADEDTELRDLVAQSLESNGVLGKIRAQLRASVFLALEEQESVQHKNPFSNPDLKNYLTTKEGQVIFGLVKDLFEYFNLDYTLAVLEPEAGTNQFKSTRENLIRDLHLDNVEPPKGPLFSHVLAQAQSASGKRGLSRNVGEESSNSQSDDRESSPATNIPKDLTQKQIADARTKFEYYDKDRNNEIDKDELRELFLDLFPTFNKNMLDRYVNDEFRATDRDFSSSISFNEFLGMYKRLFIQCRSVVSGEVGDLLHRPSERTAVTSPPLSYRSTDSNSVVEAKNQRNLQSNNGSNFRNGQGNAQDADLLGGSDLEEEDPFFDDAIPGSRGLGLSTSFGDERNSSNGSIKSPTQSKGGKSSMSSLSGLPSLGRNSKQSSKPSSENMKDMSKKMADLGLDDDNFDYDDDFQSEEHSLSLKSPRTVSRSEVKSQNENGSIAEEIEEDISVEASGFDDLITEDRSVSQNDGFDYAEDPQLP